jgi:hypothetical protein
MKLGLHCRKERTVAQPLLMPGGDTVRVVAVEKVTKLVCQMTPLFLNLPSPKPIQCETDI